MSDPTDPNYIEMAHTGGGLGGLAAVGYLFVARFFGGKEREEVLSAVGEIKTMVADVAASVHELRRDMAVSTERANATAAQLAEAREEIQRLRERYHDLMSTVTAVLGRVSVLEERRQTGEHRMATP